jgi:hypothetical protein
MLEPAIGGNRAYRSQLFLGGDADFAEPGLGFGAEAG